MMKETRTKIKSYLIDLLSKIKKNLKINSKNDIQVI